MRRNPCCHQDFPWGNFDYADDIKDCIVPNEILIRDALPRDATAVAVLLTQLGYPQDGGFVIRKMEALSRRDGAKIFVAEEEGEVVGFLSFSSEAAFHREGNIGTITAMCVLETKRGRGIGRSLIEHAETFAKESDCVRIAVASGIHRTKTHQFYHHCGFEEKTKRFVKDFIVPDSH